MRDGERLANRYDSRTWTGLYHYRHEYRIYTGLLPRLYWVLKIGLKKHLCPHDWSFVDNTCDVCGMTYEEFLDHSWHLPRAVAL